MNANVSLQVTTLSKLDTTCVTLKFLNGVSTDIPLQITRLSKLGTARVTGISYIQCDIAYYGYLDESLLHNGLHMCHVCMTFRLMQLN